MIAYFDNENRFLSNFANATVVYEGLTYLNSESAFQSAKTLDMEDRKCFCNMNPSDAKREGRKIKLREDWETVKFQVMYNVVKDKFNRNLDLADKLVATDKEELIEGNTWHDNTYGWCICDKCKDKKHINKLGKILMLIRGELNEDRWKIRII